MSHRIEQPPNNGPEQLSLLSEEELAKLQRSSALTPSKGELPSFDTDGISKACSPEGGAIQHELPYSEWADVQS